MGLWLEAVGELPMGCKKPSDGGERLTKCATDPSSSTFECLLPPGFTPRSLKRVILIPAHMNDAAYPATTNDTLKVVPFPSLLSTRIKPPCSLTIA